MDFRNLIENSLNNTKLSDFWLCEGIKEYAKQFPKISEEKFRELMSYDPTYKGGEQLGKYGNWIAQLYYNGIKNKQRNLDYKLFMRDNTSGINPKTGKPIQRPVDLPEVKDEDLEKIPNLLKQYEALKGQIKKPITMFKDVQDLYSEIEKYKQAGMPTDKKALQRYKTFKECEKKGLKKIFEDNKWIIGIPETLESSVPFGEYCNWCTTSAHGHYYYNYLDRYGGQYYILLNKQNGDLFQFHFESDQFMDENDRQIDMYNFTNENRKIAEFLHQYKSSISDDDSSNRIEKTEQKFQQTIGDVSQIKRCLYTPETSDIKVENNKITGRFDLSDVGNIVYDEHRDNFSIDFICDILTDFYGNYDFYHDDNINDYNSMNSDWNKIAKEYNIEDYDWNRIRNIYDDSDDSNNEEDNDETKDKITEIIQNDFYDGYGLLTFLHICEEYGTEANCYKDILSDLSDNLPLTKHPLIDKVGKNQTMIDFELSIEDFWKIFYVEENGWIEDIPGYKQEYQKELFNPIERMREDWFQKWNRDRDDEYSDEIGNWVYLWRVFHRKCDIDDGSYGAFSIGEPSYGWNEFDDKYFEEGCRYAAKKIAEILGRTPNKESENK